jgi:uncharacterized protein YutE (UPF0331/DUF86 family)
VHEYEEIDPHKVLESLQAGNEASPQTDE